MVDGTRAAAGTGDLIWTEDVSDARGKIPRSKIALGALDADGGDVSSVNPMPSSPTAASAGGATPYHATSVSTGPAATNVKASAGTVYSVQLINTNASPRYFKFYDAASGGAVTIGSTTPLKTLPVPGNSGSGAGLVHSFPVGINFTSGINWAITANAADTDATAVSAGDVIINFDYK